MTVELSAAAAWPSVVVSVVHGHTLGVSGSTSTSIVAHSAAGLCATHGRERVDEDIARNVFALNGGGADDR